LATDEIAKGVFLYDKPTIQTLKNCSLFWKNIIVFESYLSEVVDNPSLNDISKLFFRKGILKIVHDTEGLKQALWDKIYYKLDSELRDYLYKNPEKCVIMPERPKNYSDIIKESTERDEQDKNLQKLIDTIVKMNTYKQWFEPAIDAAWQYRYMPKEVHEQLFEKIKEIADMQYEHFHKRPSEKGRYGFEWRNEILFEQTLTSSALLIDYSWLPYYQYKLGDYSIRDARKYLSGLKTILPFVKRDSLDDFSIKDILEIRENKRWSNAMNKLGELCNNVKYSYFSDDFADEIKSLVISEMLNGLGQEEITISDLKEEVGKETLLTGIGFIPIIGSTVSAIAGVSDPIVEYMYKEKSQRTLPFFLNDIRKMPK